MESQTLTNFSQSKEPDTVRSTDTVASTGARVIAVQANLVTIEAAEAAQRPLTKNEVVCIVPRRETAHYQERLKAEVLRVRGREADAQVFESTRGVGVGDRAEQTGELLSVTLGPGLLGRVYDGLQNSLPDLSASYGNFLPRGVIAPALDLKKKWSFTPKAHVADRLKAGDTIGTVPEGRYTHKIMVPFDIAGEVEVTWIQEGNFAVDSPVARVRDHRGDEKALTMQQTWPVRRALPQKLLEQRHSERLYPDKPLVTTQRIIDHLLSDRPRRDRMHPGAVRRRQDRPAESDLTALGSRHRGRGRLRGTRRRGSGNHFRISKTHRPQDGRLVDGTHHYHLQHFFNACGSTGSLHLYRHHAGGILPADGI